MNWLTHYIRHENRHGFWIIKQEDADGRFTILFRPLMKQEVVLGSTRTPEFAIVMLLAGETRQPYEINPAQCGLPEEIEDWEAVEFSKFH